MCLVWGLMLTELIKFLWSYVNKFLTSAQAGEAFTLHMNLHVVLQLNPMLQKAMAIKSVLPAHIIVPPKELSNLCPTRCVLMSSDPLLCNASASSVLICCYSCYHCDSLGHGAQTKYFQRKHVRRLKEVQQAFGIKQCSWWVGS